MYEHTSTRHAFLSNSLFHSGTADKYSALNIYGQWLSGMNYRIKNFTNSKWAAAGAIVGHLSKDDSETFSKFIHFNRNLLLDLYNSRSDSEFPG
jgi:hypothetical protein